MTDTIIIGDGPGGLSAALFLAKNGQDVIVFGQDKTSMHWALLYNYLGIPKILGSDFQVVARKQVTDFGATIKEQIVTSIENNGSGFTVTTENGDTHTSKYLVLAEGKGVKLSAGLGLTSAGESVEAGSNGQTSVEGLYVVGRSTSIQRSQAIISAGQGAAAALDILSIELERDVRDFDTPPKGE